MVFKPPRPSKANSVLKIPFVKNKKQKTKLLQEKAWALETRVSTLSNSIPKMV